MSPPGALSPIGEKIKVTEIHLRAKSHGAKSNALADAERALSTLAASSLVLVDQTLPIFFV